MQEVEYNEELKMKALRELGVGPGGVKIDSLNRGAAASTGAGAAVELGVGLLGALSKA